MSPVAAIGRLRDAVAASAVHAAQGGPLLAVDYPYRAQLNGRYPCLELFWDETSIERGPSGETWLMTVRGQLLAAAFGDAPVEVPRIDPLVADLADLFVPATPAAYFLEVPGSAERAAHCFVARVQPSAFIAYMSEAPNHYGAELFWTVKLRRA